MFHTVSFQASSQHSRPEMTETNRCRYRFQIDLAKAQGAIGSRSRYLVFGIWLMHFSWCHNDAMEAFHKRTCQETNIEFSNVQFSIFLFQNYFDIAVVVVHAAIDLAHRHG